MNERHIGNGPIVPQALPITTNPLPPRPTKHLSLLHRLAILYLLLPVFVWVLGWFEWWVGLPVALSLAAAVGAALRGSWRFPRPRASTLCIVALAVACTMLTAHGGFVDANQNGDWMRRHAALLDLARHPWPPILTDELADHLPWGGGERSALLRTYLGWHSLPGLAGRLLGPAALQWAVPLWTGTGVALVLLLFARGVGGGGCRAVLAAGVLVLFGGMDLLRMVWLRGIDGLEFYTTGVGFLGLGIEHNFASLNWLKDVRVEYKGLLHYLQDGYRLIPSGLYALLLLQLRRHRRFVATSGVLLATATFWSPFIAMSLLPLVAILVWENGVGRRSPLWSWSNVGLAAPLVGLFALYLASGATDFGGGWLWERYPWQRIRRWAPLFYLSECVPHLLLVCALRPRYVVKPFFVASAAALLLLPWFTIGHINLTMQGACPHLVLLCHFCLRALFAPGPEAVRHRWTPLRQTCRWAARVGLAFALVVGAGGALLWWAYALSDTQGFRYALSGETLFARVGSEKRQDLAAEVPPLLAALLKKGAGPRHPAAEERTEVFRSEFKGYQKFLPGGRVGRLVLANEQCAYDVGQIHATFLPRDPALRPAAGVHPPHWYGGGCGVVLPLPAWAVSSVRVGQTPAADDGWAVEVLFDEDGQIAGVMRPPPCWARPTCPVNERAAAVRRAWERHLGGTPAARAVFDVYLASDRVDFVRSPCRLEDVAARFILHIVPEGVEDLPPRRRRYGFANLDFAFWERGGMLGDACVATLPLPPWPAREFRVGQSFPDRDVWRTTFRPPTRPE